MKNVYGMQICHSKKAICVLPTEGDKSVLVVCICNICTTVWILFTCLIALMKRRMDEDDRTLDGGKQSPYSSSTTGADIIVGCSCHKKDRLPDVYELG